MTCNDENEKNYEILQHRMLDILDIVKELRQSDEKNTRFILEVKGALRLIQWVGLSGAVALTTLLINYVLS